jgi:hypothetical protein
MISARDFVYKTTPRLLPQLTRTTTRRRVELYAGIRGRVDWAASLKERLAAGGNPALFVSQESQRRFDQPENQLLKFLLVRILASVESLPAELDSWLVWAAPESESGQPDSPRLVHLRLEREKMGYWLQRHLKNAYLREVSLPVSISAQHLAAARACKNSLYGEAAALYELYREVVEAAAWGRWSQALKSAAPMPAEIDLNTRRIILQA